MQFKASIIKEIMFVQILSRLALPNQFVVQNFRYVEKNFLTAMINNIIF